MAESSATTFAALKMALEKQRRIELQVVTGSMAPVIPAGGRIEVAPLSRGLKRFDIIVFWEPPVFKCHYVWHLNTTEFFMGQQSLVSRGIAGMEDLPVPLNSVLGLVVSHKMPWTLRAKILVRAVLRT